MASGLRTLGVDLDSLFMARVNAKRTDVSFRVAGVDIANRYEAIGSGTPIANTGFKYGVSDLATLFRNINEPLGTTYAMTATYFDTGFGSDAIGYNTYWGYGALSPGAFKGKTILVMEDVLHNVLGDPAFFNIAITGSPPSNFFTSIVINGRTFLSSTATFSGGADAYWSWPSTTAGLVNGGGYAPVIS